MPEPDAVRTRAQWRAEGLSDRQIDSRLASGRLQAVRRGVLTGPGEVSHLVNLRCARTAYATRDLVVSHLSAARLWGLPAPLGGWPRPHFTAATGPTHSRPDIRISVAALPDADVLRVGDLLVTSPARTVLDCLRTLPPRDGLAIADAALHRKTVTPDALAAVLASQRQWPGVRRARTLLGLADGRRESPLESWSAWAFEEVGLPRPAWQLNVFGPDGRHIGRCDCWWHGVVGEADGKSKYRLAAQERGGASARTLFMVLQEERQREQALRDVGAGLVRWAAADVLTTRRATNLAARIRAELSQAQERTPFIGRVVPT